MSISMYFGVSWLDPRLQVNETAAEWTEVKTGPKDVSIFVESYKLHMPKHFSRKGRKGSILRVQRKAFYVMINDQFLSYRK